MKTAFNKWLDEQLASPDLEIKSPATEVAEGEEVLGVVPEEIRPLWAVFDRYRNICHEKALSLLPEGGILGALLGSLIGKVDLPSKEDQTNLDRMTDQLDILKKLVWYEIQEAVGPVSRGCNIGIRKDFQVVAIPEREDSEVSIPGMSVRVAQISRG